MTHNGLVVATTVLGMFAAVGCAADSQSDMKGQELVQCQGINECKGTSECASEGGNSCEGLNECAGQGFITVPEGECIDKGGMVLESEDA